MFNITTTNEYQSIKELQVMEQYSSDALEQFIMYVTNAYNMFWFGETSPKEKIVLLGTEALNVFTKSAQAQAFIKSQKPDYIELGIPNGYTVNWGNNGSATITGEYLPVE